MPEKPDKLQAELEHEVARLRELAVKSTDPLITAKAIAASDGAVQQVILERLRSGQRLIEVFSLAASAATEVQVFFRFVPATQSVNLVDTGFLVFVDSASGGVVNGIVDPYDLQPEQRPGRPFVAISPVDTMKYAIDAQKARELDNRTDGFFKNLGIAMMRRRGDGFGGIATVTETKVYEKTKTGEYWDDEKVWYTDDYNDCAPADWLA